MPDASGREWCARCTEEGPTNRKIWEIGFSGISEVRFPKILISRNLNIQISGFPELQISGNRDFQTSNPIGKVQKSTFSEKSKNPKIRESAGVGGNGRSPLNIATHYGNGDTAMRSYMQPPVLLSTQHASDLSTALLECWPAD